MLTKWPLKQIRVNMTTQWLWFFLIPSFVFAAPHKNTAQLNVKPFLKQEPGQRLQLLKPYGLNAKNQLAKLAFDSNERLETRWDALVTVGRLDPQFARPHLEKALASSDWFMRNAALVVVPYNNRQWAIERSRLSLHDPALVVRTAAVQSLKTLNAIEAKPLLIEKLNSSENFKRGESLWIRPVIAETLAQMSDSRDRSIFEKMLKDKDIEVQKVARKTLERIAK